MKNIFVLLSLLCSILATAQDKKILNIQRTDNVPKIDGILDDIVWTETEVATNFVQYDPEMGIAAKDHQKTEVRMAYNDRAIFISAYMHDNPEDVFKVFSPRDDFGQADYFGVVFNPNNDAKNDIKFYVMSSGTQIDVLGSERRRGSGPGGDRGWNAVWDSAVKHVEDGWVVEMMIPYAALRFANEEDPVWGLQFFRKMRGAGQDYSWSPIDRTVNNQSLFHGELKGLKNIKPPTRLAFYPFLSATTASQGGESESDFSFGMDVKYGISESFTLDVTLIPDFSQAAFDKVELNLGPFEQRFDEQRQFFKEGVNLFSKGELFYSRRIGNSPVERSDVYDELVDEIDEVEDVVDNPGQVKMLNAIKVSGRNKNGLGIGVFNAITEKTYARIKNTKYDLDINNNRIDSTITYRERLTEPFTNYNIMVLDYQFNQNSSVSFVNTNVLREGHFRDANVSALLFSLADKTNTYNISGQGKMSNLNLVDGNSTGYDVSLSLGKVSGTYRYGLEGSIRDEKYNINDFGFTRETNYRRLEGDVSYQTFEPRGFLNSLTIQLEPKFNWRHSNGAYAGNEIEFGVRARTKNLMWTGIITEVSLGENRDYFEPRDQENDRYFAFKNWVMPRFYIFTNSNKRFSTSMFLRGGKLFESNRNMSLYNIRIGPEFRFNDKFTLEYDLEYDRTFGARGYVTNFDDEIIFGERNQKTIENSVTGVYNFNSLQSLSLAFRNYWSTATYDHELFTLLNDGGVTTTTGHTVNNIGFDPNRNFNIWNLDLSYEWQFAPGSQLIALYRNQLFNSTDDSLKSFGESLSDLFDQDIVHTISLKMVYFLDYNSVKSLFKKDGEVLVTP